MNTSLVYCKKCLQFFGTCMLTIAVPSNVLDLTFGPSFGLVKFSGRVHSIMPDFLFAGQGFPCCDKEGG